MKRNKLSDIHQKQFEDMAKDKDKKAVEIIKFFEENYKIRILASKISVFRKKLGLGTGKKGQPVAKEKVAAPATSEESLINIVLETRQATKDVFSGLRLELLKSRDEVFRMKKGLNV